MNKLDWSKHKKGNIDCSVDECNGELNFLEKFPYLCECGGLIHGELNPDAYGWDNEGDYYGFDRWCDKSYGR